MEKLVYGPFVTREIALQLLSLSLLMAYMAENSKRLMEARY